MFTSGDYILKFWTDIIYSPQVSLNPFLVAETVHLQVSCSPKILLPLWYFHMFKSGVYEKKFGRSLYKSKLFINEWWFLQWHFGLSTTLSCFNERVVRHMLDYYSCKKTLSHRVIWGTIIPSRHSINNLLHTPVLQHTVLTLPFPSLLLWEECKRFGIVIIL